MKKIRNFLEFMKEPILAILVAFLISQFLFMHTRVPTGSMKNTIMPGDHLLVNRVISHYRHPERGEIVVFQGETEKLIKRVIGLPNEVIDIQGNDVYINGDLLDEHEYISLEEVYDGQPVYGVSFPYTIPEGQYFVIGDNRGNSYDSRYTGPVDEDAIIAIGALKIWPIQNFGMLR